MMKKNIQIQNKTVLITGVAGFIGSHLALRLLHMEKSIKIVGLDNMNDYYDVSLKETRLSELEAFENFTFIKVNIADKKAVDEVFEQYHPNIVVNLAAQAGVRYSIESPETYIESNIIGFFNILEVCRHSYDKENQANGKDAQISDAEYHGVEHLVYASSSSVYGLNTKTPYSTTDNVEHPVSLYAATKESDELMAHAYSKLYNIPSTGLRFFTVYGPAGRPDMAYFNFTNKLVNGDIIKLYNYGNCRRDFTYIDDIVEGILRVMTHAPERQKGEDGLPVPPYRIYNIGNGHPENLLTFVNILQEELVKAGVLSSDYDFESHQQLVPMQPGDVVETYANTLPLERDFGYKPSTSLREGLRNFVQWYAKYKSPSACTD